MTTRTASVLGASLSAMILAAASGQSFSSGNLVVLTVGDGTTALSNASAPVFLQEFTTAGTFVQSLALPTAASGSNRALTQSGSATSEGSLGRSVNGHYLIVVGYDVAPGTSAVASSAPATINRVVGRIAADKSVDTSTAITDAFGSNNIRSGASIDGSGFWIAGPGSTSIAAVRYVALGAPGGTSTGVSATGAGFTANCRVVNIQFNQLYASGSTTTGPLLGVGNVGTPPPPTTGPATITQLNGFPTATGPSTYDFWFADANTLYVCDDRAPTNGGIQKWTYDTQNAIWNLAYTLNSGITNGTRTVEGVVTGGVATLYSTTGVASGGSGNSIITVTDTGAASAFTAIVSPTPNLWYRGVRFAPTGATPPPCYANCDSSTSAPVLNVADFTCFLQKYAAADPYANCDASTSPPVLNVADFTCFLQKYAAGCT